MRIGMLVLAAMLICGPALAAPGQASAAQAARLEEAFRHDLCTRSDRELRAMRRALQAQAPAASPRRSR